MSENRWKAPCKRIHRSRTYSTIVASQTSSLPDIFITLSKWLFYCRSSAFQCASFQGQKIERVMIVVSQTYTTWPESCSSLQCTKKCPKYIQRQNSFKGSLIIGCRKRELARLFCFILLCFMCPCPRKRGSGVQFYARHTIFYWCTFKKMGLR